MIVSPCDVIAVTYQSDVIKGGKDLV